VRERIGYAIAVLAAGAALIVNAVAGDGPTGAEREARDIGAATQRMGQRWDSEQIDDVRRGIDGVASQASACDARRSTTLDALLGAVERGGAPALDPSVEDLVSVRAVDGVLRRGVRARLRDHAEFMRVQRSPCDPASKADRKILKRHRERRGDINAAAARLRDLGVSGATAARFADPALPVQDRFEEVARR
jgi:hypothetical protein